MRLMQIDKLWQNYRLNINPGAIQIGGAFPLPFIQVWSRGEERAAVGFLILSLAASRSGPDQQLRVLCLARSQASL